MAQRIGKHTTQQSLIGRVALALAICLTGYLFVTNVRMNRTAFVTSNTSQMLERNSQHAKALREEIRLLDAKINLLNKTLGNTNNTSQESSQDAGTSTMLPAVKGPGLTVTLNDSPLWRSAINGSGTARNINDYVIHQQDIEAVVNALWRGGAEAMTIQDQRVLFNSAVVCVGNVLMLQGHQYSPPYKISAVGPVDDMLKALHDSPAIRTYQEYVSTFGLGWDVQKKEELRFPESSAFLQPLRYASTLKQ